MGIPLLQSCLISSSVLGGTIRALTLQVVVGVELVVVSFRWYNPCVNVAGSGGGGAGWISPFHVNYICRAVGVGPDWYRALNAAANIVSMNNQRTTSPL